MRRNLLKAAFWVMVLVLVTVMIIPHAAASPPPPTPGPVYLVGDVNFDNALAIDDAYLIAKYLAGIAVLEDIALLIGDVNRNGRLDIVDALFIAQYLAGIRETLISP